MKKFLYILLVASLMACSYDEFIDTYPVSIQLIYPEGSIEPYAGAVVELRDGMSSVFVSETNKKGVATYLVPAGIYEATSSTQFLDTVGDTWWRYNFNGIKSMIIIAPDSSNAIQIPLSMSRKRIVH
jgi:hypothetical protein